MKTLALTILLSLSHPQSDSTIVAPKPRIVVVDSAKTVADTTKRPGMSTETVIGSLVALIALYIIIGPKQK
jgi:hypothetical protein